MSDFNSIAQQLLESASQLAGTDESAKVLAFFDGLPDEAALHERMVLVARNEEEAKLAKRLGKSVGADVIEVPDVNLGREGQINLVSVIALSQNVLDAGELAIVLVGRKGELIDMMHVMPVAEQMDIFDTISDDSDKRHTRRAVFQRVLSIALSLASEGREGKSVGGFFVVGDADKVSEHTEQLIMNPFRGYPSAARNILDDELVETVKEFSFIDGAFVIRGDGVIESAGTLIRASLVEEDLPKGLGSRHAAAAGITRVTSSLAITVSQSDGTVRVWRKGKIVTDFERPGR